MITMSLNMSNRFPTIPLYGVLYHILGQVVLHRLAQCLRSYTMDRMQCGLILHLYCSLQKINFQKTPGFIFVPMSQALGIIKRVLCLDSQSVKMKIETRLSGLKFNCYRFAKATPLNSTIRTLSMMMLNLCMNIAKRGRAIDLRKTVRAHSPGLITNRQRFLTLSSLVEGLK